MRTGAPLLPGCGCVCVAAVVSVSSICSLGLGIEPVASHTLGEHSALKLYPWSLFSFFLFLDSVSLSHHSRTRTCDPSVLTS